MEINLSADQYTLVVQVAATFHFVIQCAVSDIFQHEREITIDFFLQIS